MCFQKNFTYIFPFHPYDHSLENLSLAKMYCSQNIRYLETSLKTHPQSLSSSGGNSHVNRKSSENLMKIKLEVSKLVLGAHDVSWEGLNQ